MCYHTAGTCTDVEPGLLTATTLPVLKGVRRYQRLGL